MALSRTGRWLPVDRLLLGYLAIVSVVALTRLTSHPPIAWVLLANGLIAFLVVLVTRPDLGRIGRGLRELYPLLLLVALYGSLDLLSGAGAVRVWDRTVQGWEAALFGGQVSRDWWQAAPSRLWSTVLHGAYFAYYLIVPLPPFLFAWRGETEALRRAVLVILAAFLLSYLCFLFFPVAGPYYEFPRPSAEFLDNSMARLVYGTLAEGSAYGAAFPSSHVAATVAATGAAFYGSRPLGLALVLPTLLLTVGTVYCQMHYAVDVLAGLVLGLALVVLGARFPRSRGRA